MKYFSLLFFFLSFSLQMFAQENEETEVTSEEAVIFGDGINNRGVWATTSIGIGLTNRKTNSFVIKDLTRPAFHIRCIANVGIGKKMKIGAGLERNGFYYNSSDSVKTYSNTVFVNLSYRILDQKDYYIALGTNVGIPTMGIISQGAINRDDSTFMASFGGKSINVFAQQMYRINPEVNIFTEFGYSYMNFPEFGRFTFSQTRKDAIVEHANPNDLNSEKMNLKWNLIYIRFGLAFKF